MISDLDFRKVSDGFEVEMVIVSIIIYKILGIYTYRIN